MKEALKLFGAMAAIIFSVSAFHDLQPKAATAATAVTAATADSSVICRRQLCSSSDQCPCGACVASQCTTTGVTGNAF
ncbi:MAG TPA: hypothetical protein VGH20_16370 [Myxococcales bacterium]